MANALWEDGKVAEAKACWRRTIQLKPDAADAYCNLSMMLYERQRLAEAAEVLTQWLRLAPDNPVARHMVAAFTGRDVPARAADEYVRSSFDHFARTFDAKLQQLDYRAPNWSWPQSPRPWATPRRTGGLGRRLRDRLVRPALAALCPPADRRRSLAGHGRKGPRTAGLR